VSVAADSAGAGLWVLDYGTGVFWATERARAIFGYSPDEEITLERLRASVHPDDWDVVRDALERPPHGRDPVSVDYRVVLGDGRVRWISSRGRFQLKPTGEPERLTGASTDITERREAEEAFRGSEARLASGAELAGLAFYEVNFERGVAYVDARFREMCGLPPERDRDLEALYHWMEHVHPDDRPRVMEMRARFHDGRQDQASVEYRYLHPVRGEVWIHHLGRVARRDATGRAVVTDGEGKASVRLSQRDAHRARAGVTGDVVQRLLPHAEQAERGVPPQTGRHGGEVHRHRGGSRVAEPLARGPERLDEAELLENRRVQLVREGVDVLAQAREPLAHRAQLLRLRRVRRRELGAADVDRQHGEPLRHVVVELAREQRALVLVGPDQALGEVAQLVLGPLALGDVAEDTEGADRASGVVARAGSR